MITCRRFAMTILARSRRNWFWWIANGTAWNSRPFQPALSMRLNASASWTLMRRCSTQTMSKLRINFSGQMARAVLVNSSVTANNLRTRAYFVRSNWKFRTQKWFENSDLVYAHNCWSAKTWSRLRLWILTSDTSSLQILSTLLWLT